MRPPLWLLLSLLLTACATAPADVPDPGAPIGADPPAASERIVPGERMGVIARLGQPGGEIRARGPRRSAAFSPLETHYFEHYLVVVCQLDDAVRIVQVDAAHPRAPTLRTDAGLGFDASRARLASVLGEADRRAAFRDYEALYFDAGPAPADGYVYFGYRDDHAIPVTLGVGAPGCAP